jgi:hypothetical protein
LRMQTHDTNHTEHGQRLVLEQDQLHHRWWRLERRLSQKYLAQDRAQHSTGRINQPLDAACSLATEAQQRPSKAQQHHNRDSSTQIQHGIARTRTSKSLSFINFLRGAYHCISSSCRVTATHRKVYPVSGVRVTAQRPPLAPSTSFVVCRSERQWGGLGEEAVALDATRQAEQSRAESGEAKRKRTLNLISSAGPLKRELRSWTHTKPWPAAGQRRTHTHTHTQRERERERERERDAPETEIIMPSSSMT